ncbi:MAG TPA: hypothetical protein VL424_20180 [Pararobbsia sp.]|nr:hypothetical protein [Pararobbsia sp.]
MANGAIWLLGSIGIATGIVRDMRRMGINRVGFSRPAWFVASVCGGPLAAIVYLVLRRSARRRLVDSVWLMVGDSSHLREVRHARLLTLRAHDLIGEVVFKTCLRSIESTPTRR